jgi:phage gp29-like protein
MNATWICCKRKAARPEPPLEEIPLAQNIYTRNKLKGMLDEIQKEQYQKNLNDYVSRIRQAILNTACSSTKTTHYVRFSLTDDEKHRKLLTDLIYKLKEEFIDVSIEYKCQLDMQTGKPLNEGIYIDWS